MPIGFRIFSFAGSLRKDSYVMVAFAKDKISEQGKLTDEHTQAKIGELIVSLVSWAKRLGKS